MRCSDGRRAKCGGQPGHRGPSDLPSVMAHDVAAVPRNLEKGALSAADG